jgi:hypothetical protein
MYVYTYALFMYMYVYVCMYVCMYTHTHMCVCVCVCVCVCLCVELVYTHTCTYVCIHRRAEAGEHGRAGWPNTCYGVSKAALNALTRIQARDLAGRQILVNSCCPGWCATDMSSNSGH